MFLTMGYGVYFFFSSLMTLSVVFVFFLVPETRGVPLEAVDRLFEVKPVYRAHGQIMEELKEQGAQFRRGLGGVDLTQEKAEVEQRETRRA